MNVNNTNFGASMPAHIAGRNARRSLTADARQGLMIARPPRISIGGGYFTVLSADGQPVRPPSLQLNFIVVDVLPVPARIYYDVPYQERSRTPPACFSDNGIGPSVNALHPQSPLCQGCPQNERGSDVTFQGFETTACEPRKKLAVILPDDPQLNIYEFVITPGSLKAFNAYVAWVGRQVGPNEQAMELFDVVTQASPDPNKKYCFVFQAIGWVDPVNEQKVQYIEDNHLADEVVNRHDKPADPQTVARMLAMRPQQQTLARPDREAPAQPQWTPPQPQLAPAPQQWAPPPQAAPQPQQWAPPPQPQQWAPPPQAAPAPAPAPAAPPPVAPQQAQNVPLEAPTTKKPVGRPRKPKETPAADPVAAGHQAPAGTSFQPPGFVTHGNMQQPGQPPSALDQAMAMLPPKQ